MVFLWVFVVKILIWIIRLVSLGGFRLWVRNRYFREVGSNVG